jgi:hypothetical protein
MARGIYDIALQQQFLLARVRISVGDFVFVDKKIITVSSIIQKEIVMAFPFFHVSREPSLLLHSHFRIANEPPCRSSAINQAISDVEIDRFLFFQNKNENL